jgi:hypothetical protein
VIAVHATLAALLGLVTPSTSQGPRFPAVPSEKPAATATATAERHPIQFASTGHP